MRGARISIGAAATAVLQIEIELALLAWQRAAALDHAHDRRASCVGRSVRDPDGRASLSPAARLAVAWVIAALVFAATSVACLGSGGLSFAMAALPLAGVSILGGAIAGSCSLGVNARIVLATAILTIPAASGWERATASRRHEETATSVVVPVAPSAAWDALKSFDRLDARRPWPMAIGGLPEPLRCSVEAEAVGARRTCYFRTGHIEERIVVWDPPRRMELTITSVDLPELPRIELTGAVYDITVEKAGRWSRAPPRCRRPSSQPGIRRTIERAGLSIEHAYLLSAIANRLTVRGETP